MKLARLQGSQKVDVQWNFQVILFLFGKFLRLLKFSDINVSFCSRILWNLGLFKENFENAPEKNNL